MTLGEFRRWSANMPNEITLEHRVAGAWFGIDPTEVRALMIYEGNKISKSTNREVK